MGLYDYYRLGAAAQFITKGFYMKSLHLMQRVARHFTEKSSVMDRFR